MLRVGNTSCLGAGEFLSVPFKGGGLELSVQAVSFHLLMATPLLLHLCRLHVVQFDEPRPLNNNDVGTAHDQSSPSWRGRSSSRPIHVLERTGSARARPLRKT